MQLRPSSRAAARSDLPPDARSSRKDRPQVISMRNGKASLLFELDAKINQFQSALANALGLDLIAFRTNEPHAQGAGFRGASADESSTSVSPGEELYVQVHASQATSETKLEKVWLESRTGDDMEEQRLQAARSIQPAPVSDPVFTVHVAENAAADRALLHPAQHRAALLRHRESAVARALLRSLSARCVGGVHLRWPPHPHRRSRANPPTRHRPRRLL